MYIFSSFFQNEKSCFKILYFSINLINLFINYNLFSKLFQEMNLNHLFCGLRKNGKSYFFFIVPIFIN